MAEKKHIVHVVGTGTIGDMACHTANMAFKALKLAHPTKVSGEAGDVNPLTCPSWATVAIEFPKRGDLPVVFNIARPAYIAAHIPAGPAPMMTTSKW